MEAVMACTEQKWYTDKIGRFLRGSCFGDIVMAVLRNGKCAWPDPLPLIPCDSGMAVATRGFKTSQSDPPDSGYLNHYSI